MKLAIIFAIAALFAIALADVKSDSLAAHNKYRDALGIQELTWSSSLAKSAQTWANYLAKYKKTSHSKNRYNIGENIASGSSKLYSASKFVDLWGAEEKNFVEGENYPDCSATGAVSAVEHYTQMVWENTTKVGCAIASKSGTLYFVCQYSPAGNIKGQEVYTVTESEPEAEEEEEEEESGSETTTGTTTGSTTGSTTGTTTGTTTGSTTGTSTGTTTGSTTSSGSTSTSTTASSSDTASGQKSATTDATFISDSLAVHNDERESYGVPALAWNNSLAASAQAYADTQASTGNTGHSSGRVNVGENLAWGSGSKINTAYLGGLWVDEREYFISGEDFPDCSTTGSWSDVAHYTQLMWKKTTSVGCGMGKSSSGRYYYVCHYYPQGNINGNPVY